MKDYHSLLAEKRQTVIASVVGILGGKSRPPSNKLFVAGTRVTSVSELAEVLFARVSVEYLESCPAELLAEIATFSFEALTSFRQESHEILVSHKIVGSDEAGTTRTIILSLLIDRPFIVDTTQETFTEEKISPTLLAHPIVVFNSDIQLSLAVADFAGRLPATTIKRVEDSLCSSFSKLFLIVDHYVGMRRAIKDYGESYYSTSDSDRALEPLALINWLLDGGMVIVGVRTSKLSAGIFADPEFQSEYSRQNTPQVTSDSSDYPVFYHKLAYRSPIHRFQLLDEFVFSSLDGKVDDDLRLVGLFTTSSTFREVSSIPVVRRRVRQVLEELGFIPGSYDFKEILSVLDRIPKSDIFQAGVAQLAEDAQLSLSLESRLDVGLRLRKDAAGKFYSLLCIIPRGRFSPEARDQIQIFLEESFKTTGISHEHKSAATSSPVVVLQYLIPISKDTPENISELDIRKEVIRSIQSWNDLVWKRLMGLEIKHNPYLRDLIRAFGSDYKATTPPDDAAKDISNLLRLTTAQPIVVEPIVSDSDRRLVWLTIYKVGSDLSLSSILPVLENYGFTVLQEFSSTVPFLWEKGERPPEDLPVGIHRFKLQARRDLMVNDETSARFVDSVIGVLNGSLVNDPLNELTLSAGLTSMEVALIRTIVSYLWQIKAISSIGSAQDAATNHPRMIGLIVGCFLSWFNPKTGPVAPDHLREQFYCELQQVSSIAADRSLRAMFNVVESCLRTNFFKVGNTPRIALKIDCSKILSMPSPRPLYEIYISSPQFEGVHLRGGMIARGGIRHSDREEDFRTEVLGLMKTQMVKNSVIVPVGAKGGFVIKGKDTVTPDYIRSIYRSYVSTMLDITDNLDPAGTTVHPVDVVRYDEDDPYFVVAADKGTATYSDLANEIAEKDFQFWLGDAFASGGSFGYDHKKLAITSRGAWETTCRHFRELGKDPNVDVITVVGIGDMSGDVFGNGLLRSRSVKLIGAFNHKHIFIDPDPDPQSSFDERLRLFNTPGSQWSDYNSKLLSKGGGVFLRSDKEIKLSKEAVSALDCTTSSMSGEELIKAVLRAPVDLLWNGGIGTYVKGSTEEHSAVGDKANDNVRVNGIELRSKVVTEGGNLGFTQLGRNEYEYTGGRINTDAIDNSGGVNCSDYEVNLKILLKDVEAQGLLNREQRNELLRSLSEEVCQRVVARNSSQSRAISIFQPRTRKNLASIDDFVKFMEKSGLFNRKTEFFPTTTDLERRKLEGSGLSRAELAVVIGFSKMHLKSILLDSPLPDQDFLRPVLHGYFPAIVAEKFSAQVEKHKLRRQIVAALVANQIVEDIGPTTVHQLATAYDIPFHGVASVLISAFELLDFTNLKKELTGLESPTTVSNIYSMLNRAASAIENMARWILDRHLISLSPVEITNIYRNGYLSIASSLRDLLQPDEIDHFDDQRKQLLELGLSDQTVAILSSLPYALVLMDAVDIAQQLGLKPLPVATAFSKLYDVLNIRVLVERSVRSKTNDPWEESALRSILLQIRRFLSMIVLSALKQSDGADDALDRFCERNAGPIATVNEVANAALKSNINLAKLMVIAQRMRVLTNV
jgi:glutamate dehydrogenase